MRKAQSALEYAVVVTAIIAAFVAMNIYVKRAVYANLNDLQQQINESPE